MICLFLLSVMTCYQRISGIILAILLGLACIRQCSPFKSIDTKYYLVAEAYKLAKDLFIQGRTNYDLLKNRSLEAIDTFLDLVNIMNGEMARELRSAVIKFYKIKYFHDFTNYVISVEEMIDITEHCLVEPLEKLSVIREHFRGIVRNFEDVRNFSPVEKCREQLPDEVAAAHCILHQAVLFNETMQDSLISIVKIKTRQHAQDMNISLYNVQKCFNNFVPKFFDQLLIDSYTNDSGYLKVVNASIDDLIKDKWKTNETVFPKKWTPLVKMLKEKSKSPDSLFHQPLYLTLLETNVTSQHFVNKSYLGKIS